MTGSSLAGKTIKLFDWSGVNPTDGNLNIVFGPGWGLNTSQLFSSGDVIVAAAGDANCDGRVDINDLTVVLAHFNQTGMGWTQGSMDGDPTGTVDVNDMTIVLANYGNTYGASSGMAAVPEPTCVVLLAASAASLLALARRKRRAS